MDNILKNYFGCENPFDQYGKITPKGEAAQEKLIQLLKDLALVIPDVISEDDARNAERMIDEICNDYDWFNRGLDLLKERYPDDSFDLLLDFMQYWENLATDEENLKCYEQMRDAGELDETY